MGEFEVLEKHQQPEYIGIARPLSPASLAARERMVLELLADGLGMTEPEPASD